MDSFLCIPILFYFLTLGRNCIIPFYMDRIAIEVKNLYKEYTLIDNISYKEFLFSFFNKKKIVKKIPVLNGISFKVLKGEAVGIIGKNGAGKSTLLGILAGVLKPTKGIINRYGRVHPLLELGAGFHPDLNAYENIILTGVLLGIPRREVLKNMEKILEFAELKDYAEQPIRTYSSGMLARLGFSIITLLNPEILLIDEVLAVGDISFREKCLNFMFNLKKKVTIILVSHNLEEIQFICDKAIWIDGGYIRSQGPVDHVIREYIIGGKQ